MIFIGGCPRSGTTLVKRILDAHSQIYCGPEFGHLPNLCNQYNIMQKGIRLGRISAYASEEELKVNFREFIIKFMQSALGDRSMCYFAEKTPDNLRAFFTLFEIFPEARFIHVVRNPLDVVASYLRIGKRSKRDPVKFPQFYSAYFATKTWQKKVNALWNQKDRFDDPAFQKNYLEIKYEDLVQQPETEISNLCAWLEIPSELAQLIRLPQFKTEGDPVSFENVFYTKEEYYRPINDSSVDNFMQYLTRAEILDVIHVAGPLMVKKGYLNQQALREYQAERREVVGNVANEKDQDDLVNVLGKLLVEAQDRNAVLEEFVNENGLYMTPDGKFHRKTPKELLKLAFSRLFEKKEQQ